MSGVEQAAYDVVRSENRIEIRRYSAMIVAEVGVSGRRKPAISRGFRVIAGYIFGANATSRRVAMTAPVMQQLADRKSPRWFVRFVMPREWTIETLPRPSDPLVSLKTMPAGTYAAITFSGLHLKWTLERQTRILERFMAREKFEGEGQPIMAFFDPPWTFPTRVGGTKS